MLLHFTFIFTSLLLYLTFADILCDKYIFLVIQCTWKLVLYLLYCILHICIIFLLWIGHAHSVLSLEYFVLYFFNRAILCCHMLPLHNARGWLCYVFYIVLWCPGIFVLHFLGSFVLNHNVQTYLHYRFFLFLIFENTCMLSVKIRECILNSLEKKKKIYNY